MVLIYHAGGTLINFIQKSSVAIMVPLQSGFRCNACCSFLTDRCTRAEKKILWKNRKLAEIELAIKNVKWCSAPKIVPFLLQ